MNLLIADSDAVNRELLRQQLEAEGHRVVVAAHGAEVLQALERESVDGVISDVLMSSFDGFRLCLEIRKNGAFKRVPFVLYSAHSRAEDQQLAEAVGAGRCIRTPAPTAAIIEVLREAAGEMRQSAGGAPTTHEEIHVPNRHHQALVRSFGERDAEADGAFEHLRSTYEEIRAAEALFRALVENGYEAVSLLGGNGTILYRSPCAARMLGYPAEDLPDQEAFSLVHPDDLPAARQWLDALLRDSSIKAQCILRFRHNDGDWRWLEGTGVNMLAQPEIGAIVVNHRDVSERERAEVSLKEVQDRVNAIVETAIEGIITIDERGRIESINPAATRIFGYTPAEIAGQNVSGLMPSPYAEWHDAHLANYLRTGEKKVIGIGREVVGLRKDGTIFPLDLQVAELRAGGERKFAGFLRDLTERRLQEQRIEKLSRISTISTEINAAIVRSTNRKALFDEACRIAVDHGKFAVAWIGSYDPVVEELSPVAWAGEDARSLAMTGSGSGGAYRPNRFTTQAILNRRPVFNNDITLNIHEGGPRRREAMERGYRSLIVLPLLIEGEVVGNFSLFAKEADFFNDEEICLLEELARNLSFSLDHIAQQEEIDKLSRIRLVSSEINATIVRVRQRQELFHETCRIVSERGKFEFVWIAVIDGEQKQIRPVAWTGFPGDTVHSDNWATLIGSGGAVSEAILNRRTAVRNDLEVDAASSTLRKEAFRNGCRSVVSLPLVVEDEVVAVMCLYATSRGFFDKDELALLDEAAADISFALQNIAKQERLDYLSYFDAQTGLPNRTLFLDRIGQLLHTRQGEPLMASLILIDVERFGYINETFGRQGGDALLKALAHRLAAAFDGKDNVARIGANAFGVILRGLQDAVGVAHVLDDRIVRCFREPFALETAELRLSAKAGIAMFPADGSDADTLFKNAEAALKRAKASSERYLFYAADMNARAAHALSLETRLRKAVEAQQFVLHYQPKFSLGDGVLRGVEALIRWQEPGAGLVPPGAFIPVLEETGLILEVGKWALGRALSDYREWQARGWTAPRIAVNVSTIQLQQRDFTDIVIAAIRQAGNIPEALELEVTESLIMKDLADSIRKLSIVRELGIHIAMDDFGTGYSSLSYVARLPINSLKIDRSFINGMSAEEQEMSIVRTIIVLAHSLKLKVVAEGVETEEQANMLRLMNCDEAQGYLYSRPLPATEVERLLVSSSTA